jgi:hypothetical protein
MIVKAGSAIDSPLFEGALGFAETGDRLRSAVAADEAAAWEPPTVVIGEPQWWNVEQTLAREDAPLPVDMRQLLADADFYAVRFACSFAASEETLIERARLAVKLKPLVPGAANPIAFDMHPQDVFDVTRKKVAIKLAPSLKLHEVELSAGEAGLNFEYDELVPEVTAYGVQAPEFSWDVKPSRSRAVRGVRLFHAVLKVGRGSGAAVTHLQLNAWVRARGVLYHLVTPLRNVDSMTRTVGPRR